MKTAEYIADLSKCVKCGSCKAHCPTYEEGLSEAVTARGRLTLLRGFMSGLLGPSPLLNDRIFSCILCGACESLCPAHVDITGSIYRGRSLLRGSDRERRLLRLLTRFSVQRPMLLYRGARLLQHLLLPYVMKKSRMRLRVGIPPQPLRDGQQVYKPEKKIGRVALFAGCSTNFLFPHLGLSLINVLLRLGYEVVLPQGEMCCGAPLRSLGLEEEAVDAARKNYQIFSKLNTDAVLSLCPTCVLSLKTHYPDLIGEGLENAQDASGFLADKLGSLTPGPLRSFTTVTYHDPCHLSYSLGIRKEPRQIIRATGVEFIEAEGEGCCGFGGLFGLQYGDISQGLLEKRLDAYDRTDAASIITSCTGCMLQLGSGLRDKQVFHIIELIEEAFC
jgi:glycolate oxidase iron-sulfur subunit